MAYDEGLAERLREVLEGEPLTEKRMFGGLAFLDRGHMACGIVKEELMVRVGPGAYEAAVKRPHAREMDFTGRPMKGMVMVAPAGFESDEALAGWVRDALVFTRSLPAK